MQNSLVTFAKVIGKESTAKLTFGDMLKYMAWMEKRLQGKQFPTIPQIKFRRK